MAYGQDAESFDTGKATRVLTTFLRLPTLLSILGLDSGSRIVDWGGGGGLLTRLMRDVGYDYLCYDEYRNPEYSAGFQWNAQSTTTANAITLFEVAEHFNSPWNEWARLFSLAPRVVVGTTGIYTGQGSDWPYLSPENGQHLFFYSRRALQWLARQFGYTALILGEYFIFVSDPPAQSTLDALHHWYRNENAVMGRTLTAWHSSRYQKALSDHSALAHRRRPPRRPSRVLIDLVFFQYHRTGIARLWDSLLSEWQHTSFASHLVLLDRGGTSPDYENITKLTIPSHRYGCRTEDIELLEKVSKQTNASVFLSSYYTRPVTTPTLMLVYDCIPEVLQMDLSNVMWQEKADAISHAACFVAISESTKRDLARFYQIPLHSISVAQCGVDACFTPAPASAIKRFRDRHGLRSPYVLFVGSRGDYKNARVLIHAMNKRKKDDALELLFVGGNVNLEPELRELAANIPHRLLQLNDQELRIAYSAATALVYPSYYEGFGLPIVEAMATGCPVITTRFGSLPEVAGEAALYVAPDDPNGLNDAIDAATDPTIRYRLTTRGLDRCGQFSWQNMAISLRSAIEAFCLT